MECDHPNLVVPLEKVCRELELAGTPTPSDAGMGYEEDDETGGSRQLASSKTQEADALQAWERTLIDNLLNFASTPKVCYLTYCVLLCCF